MDGAFGVGGPGAAARRIARVCDSVAVSALIVLVAIGVVIGLLGIVVPVLPGLFLTWASVVVWAAVVRQTPAWVVAGVVTVLYAAGLVLQYLFPGRRMKASGVAWTTIAAGVVGGIIGFFVLPVLGAIAGFVAGILLVEFTKTRSLQSAWPLTVAALKAIGQSMLIELTTGLLIAGTWVGAVIAGVGR